MTYYIPCTVYVAVWGPAVSYACVTFRGSAGVASLTAFIAVPGPDAAHFAESFLAQTPRLEPRSKLFEGDCAAVDSIVAISLLAMCKGLILA